MSTVALEIEELIAAPLTALVDSQKGSALATSNFLMAFTKEKDGKLALETIDIKYERMVHDPNTGEIKSEEQSLKVPLLTLLPIPYIAIDEADINFDLKIIKKEEKELKIETSKEPIKIAKLYAAYASRNKSTIDYSGEMNIKIKVKRSEPPEGLAKMLTILSDGITISR